MGKSLGGRGDVSPPENIMGGYPLLTNYYILIIIRHNKNIWYHI